MGPRPAASATLENLLGIQVLGPHTRLALGTERLGGSPKFVKTGGLVTYKIIQKVEIQSSQITEFLNFPSECLKIPKEDLGKLNYS